MKVARTFTLDLKVVEILKKRSNQSRTVEAALRNWFDDYENQSVQTIPTRNLLAVLHAREDVSEALMVLIRHELTSTAPEESSS